NDPQDKSIHVAITTDNNVLISYCAVVRKTLHHAGKDFDCWGLTGVMTFTPFVCMGFETRIVDIATKIIDESGCDIGMFHCSKESKPFYEKSGWEAMENTKTLTGDVENPELSDELMMMRFVSKLGKSKRKDFVNTQVYFGEDTW
ncbi:hypothetical protein KC573_03580, partial [candidate division WWE3 bacterium]|nr:hypothetical protein [candidate division WWE3 bacterium]